MRILNEGTDYTFLQRDTGYGLVDTVPLTKEGKKLERVTSPSFGQIVLLNEGDHLVPVKVMEGTYNENGRVSNYWTWRNLITKESERGYGFFYESPFEKVKG